MHPQLGLVIFLSVSLVLALVLGIITHRLHLSPIVGYLLAGILIGPRTPGFVADPLLAQQLAEIGVVLLMFGVGLHFDLRDLLAVRRIAIPGAVAQITVATTLAMLVAVLFGLSAAAGLIVGLAVSVASTVVLVRVLMDNDVLHTPHGHIAIGWLIVEDIFTVLVLVALPGIAGLFAQAGEEGQGILLAMAVAMGKIALLSLIVIAGGRRVIPWLLRLVASTRSRELFTLTVLALALTIATGSAVIFGVSMALGAFLAGMVVGQTEVSHQAAADALPMRDAFSVLFFVSVGILFDPMVIVERPLLLLCLLAIVLIAKPLTAFLIVWLLRYSVRTAFTVAVGLAQIGEFSFILAEEARHLRLLTAEGQSLLVACAIISITLNPALFRTIEPWQRWLRGRRWLWQILTRRQERGGAQLNIEMQRRLQAAGDSGEQKVKAVVVGYGPVGQTASRILREFDIQPVIIDLNLDTVRSLAASGEIAIYGDATQRDILEAASIADAKYLLLTIPEVLVRTVVILAAKDLNPELRIFVRARYLQERAWLEEVGATAIVTEEAETAVGLAVQLLREVGADEERIRSEIRQIHAELNPPLS
jgi:CPA2 family monovalent cation:H+ antiporter-2